MGGDVTDNVHDLPDARRRRLIRRLEMVKLVRRLAQEDLSSRTLRRLFAQVLTADMLY